MPTRISVESGAEYLLPFAKRKLAQMKETGLHTCRVDVSNGTRIFIQNAEAITEGAVDTIRIFGGAFTGDNIAFIADGDKVDLVNSYLGDGNTALESRGFVQSSQAYSSKARCPSAYGEALVLSALRKVVYPPGAAVSSQQVVTPVGTTAIVEHCVATISRSNVPFYAATKVAAATLNAFFAKKHYPLLAKLSGPLLGVAKMPATSDAPPYAPVGLTPKGFFLDVDGDVCVQFSVSQTTKDFNTTVNLIAVNTGDYDTDNAAVSYPNSYPSFVAFCKVRDIPPDFVVPIGSTSYMPSTVRTLSFLEAAPGASATVTFFDTPINVQVPIDIEARLESGDLLFTATADGLTFQYQFAGRMSDLSDATRVFTGTAGFKYVMKDSEIYFNQSAQNLNTTLNATFRFTSADRFATLHTARASRIPLDFVTVLDVRAGGAFPSWFVPNFTQPPGVHSTTWNEYHNFLGWADPPSNTRSNWEDKTWYATSWYSEDWRPEWHVFLGYQITEDAYTGGSPWCYTTTSSTDSGTHTKISISPAGTIVKTVVGSLEYATSAVDAPNSYSTTYQVSNVRGAHKSTAVSVVASATETHTEMGFDSAAHTIATDVTNVVGDPTGYFVVGVCPSAGLGVIAALDPVDINIKRYYAFHNTASLRDESLAPAEGYRVSFAKSNVAMFYDGFSYGCEGSGSLAGAYTQYSSAFNEPGATRVFFTLAAARTGGGSTPTNSMDVAEYPIANVGTSKDGLYVAAYCREVIGGTDGICVIRRAFCADLFMHLWYKFTTPGFNVDADVAALLAFFDGPAQTPNPGNGNINYDPSLTGAFSGMVASVGLLSSYFSGEFQTTRNLSLLRARVYDVVETGRIVLVNNFAPPPLIDFLTAHSQTLVIVPAEPL